MTFRKQYLDNISATEEQSRTMQIEVDKYLCNDIRKCEKENEREENQMKDRSHAAALYVTPLYRLDLSHPLKLTRTKVQQKPKQVIATATFKNIITSSRPRRIAARVTSSVENIKVSPPHAKKKLLRASVGGRDGRTERGGPNQRKK